MTERTVSIALNSLYLDFINACSTTMNMSEEDKYEEALWYKENSEQESDDVKVYKIGTLMFVDSGAAFTSVNESIELQNLKKC